MKKLIATLFMAFLLIGMVSSASAIPVDITSATPYVASGDETNVPAIEAIIFPLMSYATELYRSEPGKPDQFTLAGSYDVTYYPEGSTENALIKYVSGPYIGPTAYLLAKDGMGGQGVEDDSWFLYNLTALGWTGTEDITIVGLWPNQGDFSHISMYGTTSVPEPMTILLLGLGLVGLAGAGRKFKR